MIMPIDMLHLNIPICIIGHPFAALGMGTLLRNTFYSLQKVYDNVKIMDCWQSKSTIAINSPLASHLVESSSGSVNIYCLNGDEVDQSRIWLKNRVYNSIHNIIYPAWELPVYPPEWGEKIEQFDEVWAMSEYTKESLKNAVRKPVIRMPLACEITSRGFGSRKLFNIPESSYAFLCSFDLRSYFERKNPLAAIEAFRSVVKSNPDIDTCLVLKINGNSETHSLPSAFHDVTKECQNKVVIIDDALSGDEMMNLLFLCDCFISPHRAEGFGLGISEAMFFGIPVITTGYSGNMEFCSMSNSFLIDYTLVDVPPNAYPNWKGQVWANPKIEDLIEKIEYVLKNQSIAKTIGKLGMKTIKQKLNFNSIGLRCLAKIAESINSKCPFSICFNE